MNTALVCDHHNCSAPPAPPAPSAPPAARMTDMDLIQKWRDRVSSSEYGQKHLWHENMAKEDELAMAADLEQIDSGYPGGLINYLTRARKLLQDSKLGLNPYQGLKVSTPEVVEAEVGGPEFWEYETLGLSNIGHLGFVLVAGGLGERLGYPGIKLSLPTSVITNMSYMEYYARCILAYQKHANEIAGKHGPMAGPTIELPLAIMTSDDTYTATVELLESNNYFELSRAQVTIMKQNKVPALTDDQAHIALENGRIQLKPHGHGDIHMLLSETKVASNWLDRGVEYMVFLQDTNALTMRSVPLLLGVSMKHSWSMNSLCVPRSPGEAVGAVVQLAPQEAAETAMPLTINVEYNYLESLLSDFGGDKPRPGYSRSPYPGNCNILVFKLKPYCDALKSSGGTVPEFINPKYTDETRTAFKSPTRVECLMQEFARLFPSSTTTTHGCTMLPRNYCFSAVKNAVSDAVKKQKLGIPAEGCMDGEFDLFKSNIVMLRLALQHAKLAEPEICADSDFCVKESKTTVSAFVCLSPTAGPCATLLSQWNFKDAASLKLRLGKRSTLVIESPVHLSGTVDVAEGAGVSLKGGVTVRNLKVANSGIQLVPITDDAKLPLSHTIRGYTSVWNSDVSYLSGSAASGASGASGASVTQ